jgi:hypothetical protein
MGSEIIGVNLEERKCWINHPNYHVIMDIVYNREEFPLGIPPVNGEPYVLLDIRRKKAYVANLPADGAKRIIEDRLWADHEGRKALSII